MQLLCKPDHQSDPCNLQYNIKLLSVPSTKEKEKKFHMVNLGLMRWLTVKNTLGKTLEAWVLSHMQVEGENWLLEVFYMLHTTLA